MKKHEKRAYKPSFLLRIRTGDEERVLIRRNSDAIGTREIVIKQLNLICSDQEKKREYTSVMRPAIDAIKRQFFSRIAVVLCGQTVRRIFVFFNFKKNVPVKKKSPLEVKARSLGELN